MAVLARLDRQAEGFGEGAATARLIAQEWEQFLDIVEESGDGAEAFLRASAPARPVADGAAKGSARRLPVADVESTASALKRLAAYRKFQAGLPHEIPVADLDPSAMADWTDGNGRGPSSAACSTGWSLRPGPKRPRGRRKRGGWQL